MAKIKYLFSFFILFFLTTEVFAANPSLEEKETFWTVQVASFPHLEYACNFLKNIQEPTGRIEKIDNWYTVRCGLFKDRTEAENLKADLEKKGVEKPLVRTCYYTPDSPRLVVLPTLMVGDPPTLMVGDPQEKPAPEKTPVAPLAVPEYQKKEVPLPKETTPSPEYQPPKGTVSLDFKNADTRNVLRILAVQNNLNIIAGKEIEGTVTVHLSNVPFEDAFRSILEINGFGYEKIGDIFWVNTLTRIKERKKDVLDLEPLITEVFQLKYLGADDLKDVIAKELSTRGNLRVLSRLIPGGWPMGGISAGETTGETTGGTTGRSLGVAERTASKKDELPTVLVVTDTPEIIRKVRDLIAKLDVKTKQILIEAMLVEVSSEVVQDIGIQWDVTEGDATFSMDGGVPSIATGLTARYAKTTGNDLLSVQIQALEEKKKANVLSHPKIMALDGREASILIGESYPVINIETTTTDAGIQTTPSVAYTPIGISLKVIPRVTEEGYINLLIHPSVTSLGENVTLTSETVAYTYKRIKTREADTNVTVKDGETVVIGGLKSEQTEENVYKVPFLGDIPLLGYLFKRTEKKPKKIDLLIFITPRIVSP